MTRLTRFSPLLLATSLALSACMPIQPIEPTGPATSGATTSTASTGGLLLSIATLPDITLADAQNAVLAGSIINDRKILLGGVGSDLWRGKDDPAGEFWMITDRGPNGQIRVDEKNRRTFPVPEFTPLILRVRVDGEALTIQATLPVLTQSGAPVTGLSDLEGHSEAPWDYAAQTKLDYNANGLDTEGIVRTAAGEFWLVDEYSPSILHIGADGHVIERFVPAGLDYSGADYLVTATLPELYGTRKNNRGFEGIALSADEKLVYAVLQSPLLNPDADTGNASINTRILALDVATGQPTAEYVYQFDDPAGYEAPDAPDEMKLSGAVALNESTLLILERTDAVAKLYSVNLAVATNTLGSKWDDVATAPSLESMTDLNGAGIVPLPKSLVIDLAQIAEMPDKIEGVAVVDAKTIAVINDNDFNLGEFDAEGNNSNTPGIKSHLLLIELAEPLPLAE